MIKARCINKPKSYWGLTEESVYDVDQIRIKDTNAE